MTRRSAQSLDVTSGADDGALFTGVSNNVNAFGAMRTSRDQFQRHVARGLPGFSTHSTKLALLRKWPVRSI
jgi:hypothetical protein